MKISSLNKMTVISHFRVISTGRLSFFMLCQKYVVWTVGGEWECPMDRQTERDCDVKSLICNGCVTQMLGVICQPGLSRRARAALGGKELDTVLSLFTPTHNGGTCKYQPPTSTLPQPGSQLRCPAMYLDAG